jgi:sulfatase maturation enzyme AslB (radical SAM superfamily)
MVDCAAIDNAIFIETDGVVKPCCKYVSHNFGHVDNLHNITFDILRKDKWPTGCYNCKRQEDNGMHSKRQQYNELYSDNNYLLDIALGNYCNLKCRMCSADNSTSWFTEARKLGMPVPKGFSLSKKQINAVFDRVDKSKNLTIELKGGEPLMNPNAEYIFQKCIEYNAEIKLITNGTLLPDWFVNLLPNLNIDFAISIDGVKNTYEYVRGDNTFSYDACIENINKIKSIIGKVRFNYVVQNYTINDMLEFDSLKLGNINWIVLQNPAYLQCHIMPDENKKPIIEELQNIHNIPIGLIDFFKKPCDSTLYKQFIEYSAKIDQFRSQSLQSTLPHLVNNIGNKYYAGV